MESALAKAEGNLNPGYGCTIIVLVLIMLIGGWFVFTHTDHPPDTSVIPRYPHEQAESVETEGNCAIKDTRTTDDAETALSFYEGSLAEPQWQYHGRDKASDYPVLRGYWSSKDTWLRIETRVDRSGYTVIEMRLCPQ